MLDGIVYNLKRDPPVAAHGNAPCPGPIPRKLVYTPAWWSLHRVYLLRHDQYGQNFAYSLDQVTPDIPVIVVLNETPQTSVSHTADIHAYYRTSIPYSVQVFFEIQTGLGRAGKKRFDPQRLWRLQPRELRSGHAPRLRQDHRVKLAGRECRRGYPLCRGMRYFVSILRAELSSRSDRMSPN